MSDHGGHFVMSEDTSSIKMNGCIKTSIQLNCHMFHGYTPKMSDHCGHFFMAEATSSFKWMGILQHKLN